MRCQARLPLEALQPYVLELPMPRGQPRPAAPFPPLSFPDVFGNRHPVEMEIGFGKGLFLLSASQAHPHLNYLGIEIERKYLWYTATRLAKRQIPNVRLVCGDARLVLRDFIPAESIQAIHVFFPDPWWKQRHRKRRLFTEDFARQCARVLQPGGCINIATDVADYYAEIRKTMSLPVELHGESPPARPTPKHDLDYLTNYERKFSKSNQPIFRTTFRKRKADTPK